MASVFRRTLLSLFQGSFSRFPDATGLTTRTLGSSHMSLSQRCVASTSSYFPSMIEKGDVPASEKPQFYNRFDMAEHVSLFEEDARLAKQHPPANGPGDLVEPTNHPHQVEGFNRFERYVHYNRTWEPVFQRSADVSKGELIAGSNLYRTTAWKGKDEPAIVSIGRYDPQKIRPAGYAENVPNPDSTVPEGIPDFRDYRLPKNSPDRRAYTYFVSASAFIMTATLARSFICCVVGLFWIPKGLVLAGKAEVDLSKIEVGREVTVDYRGKPCFVRHRTAADIQRAQEDDKLIDGLRDPELDSERAIRPEWLVVSAVCTHLGCIPHGGGEYGGYFCPCHGSHYDTSGRIRAGPAPSNLVVPPYQFVDDNTVMIGE